MNADSGSVLVHLASGIGNIVLATPLLSALSRAGLAVDVLIDADYQGVGELFDGWGALRAVYDERRERPILGSYETVLAAIPPFYWRRFAAQYARAHILPQRPPDELFYRNEQAYYLEFARQVGCDVREAPCYSLPHLARRSERSNHGVVLTPGSKPGSMAAKRWPYFAELADRFNDVVVVGTRDDLSDYSGAPMQFPKHVRSFVDDLCLRQVVDILVDGGIVVSNDCGLGHVAGALGVPTLILFGPTPDLTLGRLPRNVNALRSALDCEPCWFNGRFRACGGRIDCLRGLSVDRVAKIVQTILPEVALAR